MGDEARTTAGRSTGVLRAPATWLALAGYGAVVVALTWPLLAQAATHIAGTHGGFHMDTLHTAWIVSHESWTLTHAPATLLDARMYHPEPRTFFYNTVALGLVPYFAPTFLATGNPALAIDVAFLACLALTAWTIHLVVRRWTDDHAAATFAGLAYLLSRTTIWGFPSAAPHFAVLQYQPLLVFAVATPASRLASPVALATLVALQCLVDPLYVAPAVLLPLGTIAVWRLLRPATRPAGRRLVAVIVLAVLALAPVYAGYADVVARNPNLGAQTFWPSPRAAGSGSGLAMPTWTGIYMRVVGWWFGFTVPLVALGVIVVGAWLARRRAAPAVRAAWANVALWAVLGFALPDLHVWSPFLRGLHRTGLLVLVAASLAAGLALAASATAIGARFGAGSRRTFVAVAFVALVVWPNGPSGAMPLADLGRYPTRPAPPSDSPVIAALRSGDGPVLELPAGGGAADVQALYRGIFHRRPLLNGYSSYFPAAMLTRRPLFHRLPDPAALAALRATTNLTTLVVRTADLDPQARARWTTVLEHPDRHPQLHKILEDGGDVVFDVR